VIEALPVFHESVKEFFFSSKEFKRKRKEVEEGEEDENMVRWMEKWF